MTSLPITGSKRRRNSSCSGSGAGSRAVLSIKKKFGKNAILKGMNLEEGATARDRNDKIGGHKA